MTGSSKASFHSGIEEKVEPPRLVGNEMRRKEEQPVRVSASREEANW